MTIKVLNKTKVLSKCLIAAFFKGEDLPQRLQTFAELCDLNPLHLKRDFTAKAGRHLFLYGHQGKQKIFLLGLGSQQQFSSVQQQFRSFGYQFKSMVSAQVKVDLNYLGALGDDLTLEQFVEAAANGLALSNYHLGLYKTTKEEIHPFSQNKASIHFYVKASQSNKLQEAADRGQRMAKTQKEIFDLVNGSGNKVIPQTLADWARQSGKKNGYKVRVLTRTQIEKTGLHALLAVNRGSEYPPAFIIMEYQPKKPGRKRLKKIGLVGKGVTFDTGGLSIKGSTNMHYMKSDMGGAAAVLGAMEAIAKNQAQAHVIGIVPTTDNCVDAKSVKPGDIISSYSGKTIEIIDTDAEGRLILADGLAYLEKNYAPDIMIDLATLTGSCVRTLGYQAGGLMTNNDALAKALETSGAAVGERLWRLPLWDDYKKDIYSDVADVKNYSGRSVAGAISAGKFLEAFTNQHPAWAHLDIAGVAFGDNEYSKQKSATGYGVRLLLEFVEKHAGDI